ncbi:MAG: glycoside hydrolase family 3 N-terminal domain-containing protein [Bacteroidia bacterium]|nr:glycoside hydrolase family 3 N-terminal domain-containing protein [Bacteroidia bacterium]
MLKKRNLIFFVFSLFTAILVAQTETNLYRQAHKAALNQWVDSVYNGLSLDEQIGQLFMPIVESNSSWRTRIAGYINNQKIGGVLFSKGTLNAQAEMTNYIQSIAKTPLFVALDGEWGLSMRLADAPRFPRNIIIGAIHDEEALKQYGHEVARQCREMGIHINFAPSIDVHSNPRNPIIGTRSYGENPANVAKQGIAFARGMEENGVMAVAKHFPGHGDTSEDSHHTLPTISHDINRLDSVELHPFRQYVNAGLSGIMLGHLNVPALNTNGMPASLSFNVGQKLLKSQLGFTGLTFTDGMAMKGVSNQPEMSVKALLAGNDIILGVVNQEREFAQVKQAVENGTISRQMLEEKVRKILAYKYILGVHNFKPINIRTLSQNINSSESEWTQRKIYDKAVTLVKNNDSVLPVKALDKNRIAAVAIGVSSQNTFQTFLKKYTGVTVFQAANINGLAGITPKLKDFQTVIVSVHSARMNDSQALQQLLKSAPKSVLVLFDSPYTLNNLKASGTNAQSLVAAYDNTDFAQMSAAQAIFGGIGFAGKLPVSAGGFGVNTGIDTKKIRLSYSLPEEAGIQSLLLNNIESIALEGVRQRAYPGCYVMVVKDGTVIYDRGFGHFEHASGSRVTDETVYDLASITKAAATVPAIMKLYDEKKIRLQDNIGRFVPETKGTNKAGITIRNALFHETGVVAFIPYYTTAINPNSYTGSLFGRRSALYNARYAGAWGRTDYKFITSFISGKPSDAFHMPVAKNLYASDKMHDALLRDVIATELRSRTYRYSCLNFMLLKEVVENISNTDLNTYVKDNFYKKLGAATLTFRPLDYISINHIAPTENDPFFRKQQLRGYVHDEGAALFGGISGNAGLFSNANDLAKLSQMWLNGGEYGGERFLSEETVNLFTKTKSPNSRRGLGFDKPDPRRSSSGPTSPLTPISVFGHTGFTGTCFWIDPENKITYIFLSNRVFPERSPNRLSRLKIRERIQDEIYKAIK